MVWIIFIGFLSEAVNMTEPQVQKSLAELTADKLGVDENKFVN